jgi:hypothetical protein
MIELIASQELGLDARREHRINANSFQQNAILSYGGWQYTCFYTNKSQDRSTPGAPLLINLGRRDLRNWRGERAGQWEILTFGDYAQNEDDGHNTISLGICPGDGTIHISFDHHCDP